MSLTSTGWARPHESCFLKETRYSQNCRGGMAESARVHPHPGCPAWSKPLLHSPARPRPPAAPRQPGLSEWAVWGCPSPGGWSQGGQRAPRCVNVCPWRGPRFGGPLPVTSLACQWNNQSADLRKKWEILFEPDVRVITWEEHLRVNYKSHLPSTRIKPCAAAAADSQYPERSSGWGAEARPSVSWQDRSQTDIFRSQFYKPNS